ncbi:TlpA family protein disulfide reductase [Paenibacillus sp. y28]|uniref:TlpA family protein disulfide reductase n=1 Tax=Paenibacillus sp. y28 TaxID=3129110 RepID=UPI003017B738
MTKHLLPLLLLACTGVIMLTAINRSPASRTEAKIGYPAPSFQLSALDGANLGLQQPPAGPAVILFWASWCEPCTTEMPQWAKLYSQYKNDIRLYAINLTGRDHEADVEAFVRKYSLPFPVLLDKDMRVAEAYHIAPLPTTFFMNRDGMIVERMVGTTTDEALEEKIRKLLK